MAPGFTARTGSKHAACWRSALAALISLALVLSFFHGWIFDGDDAVVTIASVQTSSDAPGKAAPDTGAPHGDHCLAHIATVAAQDNAAAIEYVTRIHRLAAMLAPEAADLASPFKPPRA
jgi:hypothetical protein